MTCPIPSYSTCNLVSLCNRKFTEMTSQITGCSGKNCTVIKNLLDSKSLNCQSCKELLKLPVLLVNGVGNVCENCSFENKLEGVPNEIFNVLLKDLIIPCTNVIVGCEEEIPYERFDEHLKICKYRNVQCPHPGCTWMARQDILLSHFLEDHKESVIESEAFNFELNTEEPSVHFTKLLIKRNLKLLFILKQDKGELACSLFKFHKDAPCSTTVSFCNSGEENSFSLAFNIIIHSLDSIDQLYTDKKISLPRLKLMIPYCHDENVLSLNVNVPPNDQLLKSLECPFCNETMKPPLYQCEKGHTICNICKKSVSECPTCSAAISPDLKNYCLESLTNEVFYTCAYKSSGCHTVLSGGLIRDHESKCFYHSRKCPFCEFHYNSRNVLNHVKNNHRNVKNQFEFTVRRNGCYSFKPEFTMSMYVSGCFFRVSYSCQKDFSECIHLEFEMLNFDENKEMVGHLECKITIKNRETQAEVTQTQMLNSAGKNEACGRRSYSIFVPVETLCDSVDVSRKDPCRFKWELSMK